VRRFLTFSPRRLWWVFLPGLAGVALAAMLLAGAASAQDGTPALSHALEGYEQCLLCHGPQGSQPVPANHASYAENTCLACHAQSTATVTPPPPDDTPPETTTPAQPPATGGSCLDCHAQPGLSMTLASGEILPLYVDPEIYQASVHGDKLLCTDCHTSITGFPHPPLTIPDRREYNIAQYELCQRCHFDNYTKTLDSIHYLILSSGHLNAPLCTDCHGAHNVASPSQPRAKISQTCSQCHPAISEQYIASVHGEALLEDDNFDVPVCTDCHQSHTILDPRTASFRLQSVQLCSSCHGDAALMKKYGISPDVVKTYLQDFHGRTVALVEGENKDFLVEEAVCTDCHGIHDIQQVENPNSRVIKANLLETCRKCHPDATENFPGAWLSHYEPSIDKYPLIFSIKWFYIILIPFILVGLSVHVLLDLWRRITNR
jgi:predicted CXXCH cytochrome family protein